jgi:protein-S-isoprenylcysteine O-methyltransferase Ste14
MLTKRTKFLDYTFIILAIVFGVGSVAMLAFSKSIARVVFGWPDQDVLLWDAFLSIFFFLQHSVMVRKFFRQRVIKIFPPHYDGAIYAITSGIALAVVVVFWQKSQMDILVLQGIPRLIAVVCNFIGVLLFVLGASTLRPFDPLGVGPIRAHLREAIYRQGPFIIRGPYRWVRHPLYACVLIMFWANPDLTADQLLFNVLWSGWVIVATVLEERDLTREFGDMYREYKKTVPMLLPWKIPHPATTT